MRILFLPRYNRSGASSRMRAFQYIPYLQQKGWRISVSALFSDNYIKALYSNNPIWSHALKGYIKRLFSLQQLKHYDLIWIEKQNAVDSASCTYYFGRKVTDKISDDMIIKGYDEFRKAVG